MSLANKLLCRVKSSEDCERPTNPTMASESNKPERVLEKFISVRKPLLLRHTMAYHTLISSNFRRTQIRDIHLIVSEVPLNQSCAERVNS